MNDLKNKVIIITGASAGIGRQCAISCSQLGARLVILGRNEQRLAETKAMLEGTEHLLISQDLTDYSALPGMISDVVEKMGVISGFIHSAGIETVLPFRMIEPNHFEKAFAVNVILLLN